MQPPPSDVVPRGLPQIAPEPGRTGAHGCPGRPHSAEPGPLRRMGAGGFMLYGFQTGRFHAGVTAFPFSAANQTNNYLGEAGIVVSDVCSLPLLKSVLARKMRVV
jgi:hypothetical protein